MLVVGCYADVLYHIVLCLSPMALANNAYLSQILDVSIIPNVRHLLESLHIVRERKALEVWPRILKHMLISRFLRSRRQNLDVTTFTLLKRRLNARCVNDEQSDTSSRTPQAREFVSEHISLFL